MSSLDEAISVIKKYAGNAFPKVGMILGSGLAPLAEQIVNPITIPYQALGLASGTVQGHASLLVFGTIQGVSVMCLKGRLHLYEGASFESIRMLVRIVKMLGAHSLVVTCAAGSLNPKVGPGEIMLINDHINFQPGNPLVGPNDESFGPRFASLENAYDESLRNTFTKVAARMGSNVTEGVYLSALGPCFETPAEIRAFRTLGADMVGMSVVPEVIVAHQGKMRVVGFSGISNKANLDGSTVTTHEEVLKAGEIIVPKLKTMILNILRRL